MSFLSIRRRSFNVALAFSAAIGLSGCVAYPDGYSEGYPAGYYGGSTGYYSGPTGYYGGPTGYYGGPQYSPWAPSQPYYQGDYNRRYQPNDNRGAYHQGGFNQGNPPAVRPQGGPPATGGAPHYRQGPGANEKTNWGGPDGGPSR